MSARLPADQDALAWDDLICRRTGVTLRESQLPALATLVPSRVAALGLPDAAAYYERLAAEADDGSEWTELMDRLVSHETSFFRHMPTFDAIRTGIVPDLRARGRTGASTLTLLSAGCATGQEAYSLAMAAMDTEGAGGRFAVWGADISRRSIDAARAARYNARAVAAVPPPYRQRFLSATEEGGRPSYQIAPELRQCVRFTSANLYSPAAMFLNYDVILCQNVLIYFAQRAIPRLVAVLSARLNAGGYLLFGPGESPVDCPAGLESINVNGLRAFRRVGRTAVEVRS